MGRYVGETLQRRSDYAGCEGGFTLDDFRKFEEKGRLTRNKLQEPIHERKQEQGLERHETDTYQGKTETARTF